MATKTYCKDFRDYCRGLQDFQLQNVLQDEYKASRHNKSRAADYEAAKLEAEFRGWTVRKGERIE